MTHSGFSRHYRQFRHNTRVSLNFIHNYLILKKLRVNLKSNNPQRRLIGVFLLEHLGDIVACEPIVRYLKKINPDAYIIWGVKDAYREIVENNPNIDNVLIIHCLTERLLLAGTNLFDEVIDLHFHDRYCSLCFHPLKKSKNLSGIDLTNYFNYGGLLSAFSQSAGLPALDEQPLIYIPISAVSKVAHLNLPERFIVINCTSNTHQKGWPQEKWKSLIEKIVAQTGLPVFEVGLNTFFDSSFNIIHNLCGKLTILESSEVIKRATLFIGIDSGPAHLANAVLTPGVILLGSHPRFEHYQPFSGFYRQSSKVEIIQTKGLAANITVDAVLAAGCRLLS